MEPQQAVEVIVHSEWSWTQIVGSTFAAVVSALVADQVRRRRRRRREVQRGA